MAKNKRECPALGAVITSARCGEERGETIACPDDCAFDPFARQNYDAYFQLEQRVIIKTMDRYHRVAGDHAFGRLLRHVQDGAENGIEGHIDMVNLLYLKPMADGRRLMDGWREARWEGLSKDERRVAEGMSGMRMALLEIRQQIDDVTLEAVDLLDAERQPFLVADRSLVESWTRFQTLLTWIFDTPHYRRTHASAIIVEDVGNADPERSLTEITALLGGPRVLSEARDWMTDNLERVLSSLNETRAALRKKMLESIDATRGVATYRWSRSPEVTLLGQKLQAAAGFDAGDLEDDAIRNGWTQCWDLIQPREPVQNAGMERTPMRQNLGERLIGQVLVGPRGAEAAAQGKENFAEIKSRLERVAGGLVVMASERIDDFASQMLQREGLEYDPSLVPPSLLEGAKSLEMASFRTTASEDDPTENEETLLEATMRHQFETFADTPIPFLDHRTPRQAAADPSLRPRLLRLLKRQINSMDEKLAEEGGCYDANWLLLELGLNEIAFPAPPTREPDTADWDDDPEPDDLEGDTWGFGPSDTQGREAGMDRPSLPMLGAPQAGLPEIGLGLKEVERRWKAMTQSISDPSSDGVARLSHTWPEAAEILSPLQDNLDGVDVSYLLTLMLLGASVLHPRRPKGLDIDVGRWDLRLQEEENRFHDLAMGDLNGMTLAIFSEDSPQPALAHWMANVVTHTLRSTRKDGRKNREPGNQEMGRALLMISVLRAWIVELNRD